MPITEVKDGMRVIPNHVYVIPPNASMTISGGVLRLGPRGEGVPGRLSIDPFFRSLAADLQENAIGVVLSGNGSDGSIGLGEIKASGGITFAQDEKSARFPSMPLNAIKGGCVDFVLPADGIARELVRISRTDYFRSFQASETTSVANGSNEDYQQIIGFLGSSTGVDFSEYRDSTIKRRISRRMALSHKESLVNYFEFLQSNHPEVEALYRDVLINVTSFFRDPTLFESLKTLVFPALLKNKSPEVPFRVWVPGCSTGQEAYSIAISLLEFLDQLPMRPPIQIFGTDINDNASVERARAGFYPQSIESEVSPERLQRFFTREDRGYRIGKTIRDMCIFAKHNVAADPPYARVDIISCRNLLIYLSTPLQQRIIPLFHYALNPTGFLLLGASETIGRFTDLFTLVDQKQKIWAKKSCDSSSVFTFSAGTVR